MTPHCLNVTRSITIILWPDLCLNKIKITLDHEDEMFLNLSSLLSYRKSFRGWLSVLYRVATRNYPFEVCTKNGKKYMVYGHSQVYFVLKGLEAPTYRIDTDVILLPYKGRIIQLKDALENGAIYEIFIEEAYKGLAVTGSNIIDIGANIGDSSIYFALNGAKRVVAIEPQNKSYRSLISNIELNGLKDVIMPIRAGVSSRHEISVVNSSEDNPTGGTSLNKEKGNEALEMINLHYIIENFLSDVNLLKIDCEGCEYDFFLHASIEDLKEFNRIMVEYHYGSEKILNKLNQAGFETICNTGMRGYNTESIHHFTSTGIITAILKEHS